MRDQLKGLFKTQPVGGLHCLLSPRSKRTGVMQRTCQKLLGESLLKSEVIPVCLSMKRGNKWVWLQGIGGMESRWGLG